MKNPAGTVIAHKAFREDPVANKLTTPSGKIEIFSEACTKSARLGNCQRGCHHRAPRICTSLGRSKRFHAEKYPLQMIGHHYKQRTHSTYGNVEWMKEAAPQEVWINVTMRGNVKSRTAIKSGCATIGASILPAKVTERIMPGVLSMPQGAWWKPDAKGVDYGGCVNTLTAYRPSPLAKGNPQHTNLVQMEKA